MEYRLRARGRPMVWVRDEAVPVSSGTRPAHLPGVMFDITEQKRAEQRFRQLVEQLPVVTYLANEQETDGIHVLRTWPRGSRS